MNLLKNIIIDILYLLPLICQFSVFIRSLLKSAIWKPPLRGFLFFQKLISN